MKTSNANAVWQGDLKQGSGVMKLPNGQFEGPYTFTSRFQDGKGTNPEELLGAAHAGCFSMALANALATAGFTPNKVETTAKVSMDQVEGGFGITSIELDTVAEVPGIDEKTFQEKAEEAKKGCPVSKALSGVNITLKARLA